MRRAFAAVFLLLAAFPVIAQPAPLTNMKTIPLPGVSGKFDHFAYDGGANRLFAAAAGNHTVEVIDVSAGKVLQQITGLGKPHGVAWVAGSGRLFVADGSLAALKVYEGTPFKLIATLPLSDDADDMVYDEATKLLYVGHGGSSAAAPGRVAVVDTVKLTLVDNLPMKTHPEALEIDPVSHRIFVNVADSAEVAVIDGATHTVMGKLAAYPRQGQCASRFRAGIERIAAWVPDSCNRPTAECVRWPRDGVRAFQRRCRRPLLRWGNPSCLRHRRQRRRRCPGTDRR